MKFKELLSQGTLINRYKRFFVDIKYKSKIITAHCPNTGSMLGLLNIGNKVWFNYYKRSDRTSNTRGYTNNKVTDPSNVPYQFITYQEINASGRQWIRKMTLALAKELLGIIRSKYASMPLPNGEVSMDGESLKAEGREEKTNLLEELKTFLESVSLSERARQEQEQAEANQAVLSKAPLGIYIG